MPSIMTEVKPPSMQLLHSSKRVAVVEVHADGQINAGILGVSMAASISFIR